MPIVAMTANAFAEDIDHARNAGMNEHIAKPIDPRKMGEVDGKIFILSRSFWVAGSKREERREIWQNKEIFMDQPYCILVCVSACSCGSQRI